MVALSDIPESAGFVERHSTPNDRRNRLVQVTAQGERALSDGMKASAQVERDFLAALSTSDRALSSEMPLSLI